MLIKNIFGHIHFQIVHQNLVRYYSRWWLSIFSYIILLDEFIDQWIDHHFSRAKRAKCLILIGPTRTGKTSFAMSLPGRVNYFKGRWNLDAWNDYARYSVYDDIPWDQFENLNYPNKKHLLTQNGQLHVRHYHLTDSKNKNQLIMFISLCRQQTNIELPKSSMLNNQLLYSWILKMLVHYYKIQQQWHSHKNKQPTIGRKMLQSILWVCISIRLYF